MLRFNSITALLASGAAMRLGRCDDSCAKHHSKCPCQAPLPVTTPRSYQLTNPNPNPFPHSYRCVMTSLLLHRAWHDARSRIVAAVTTAPRSSMMLPRLPSSSPSSPAVAPTTLCVRWKHGAKSHQGAKKRFRLLKNGDVLRGHAGKSHNTGHRSTVQMSRLRVSTTVAPSFAARIRRLVLGV